MKKIRHKVKADNVLIAIETGEIKTESGIIIAAETTREAMAREDAVIEDMGATAFNDYEAQEKYRVGDKVIIARYSGKSLGKYEDGKERRVIQDTGILALIVEEEDNKNEA